MQFEKFGPVDMNNQASPYSELRVRKGLGAAVSHIAPRCPSRVKNSRRQSFRHTAALCQKLPLAIVA